MADFEKYLLFEKGLSPSQCLHATRSYVRDITAIAAVHIKSLTVISIFAILMFTFFPVRLFFSRDMFQTILSVHRWEPNG